MSVEHKNVHGSLVRRLREPIRDDRSAYEIARKLEALGEAIAYIIEKKHMKKRIKRHGG